MRITYPETGVVVPVVSAPAQGAVAVAARDTVKVASGNTFIINCTVAGNVKVGFADGSTLTIAVPVGTTMLPWSVTQVFVTGTTATATYANLS
jgi:hypothetical protein